MQSASIDTLKVAWLPKCIHACKEEMAALLGAKPPLVVANVACSASDTDRLCCHSFTLSLSVSASGDINQSVDTHAEAVMCYHSEGAETDKNG